MYSAANIAKIINAVSGFFVLAGLKNGVFLYFSPKLLSLSAKTKFFMEAIGYYAVRLLLSSFRFMPFPVLYALSGAVRVLLQHIIGYRSKVVMDNLRRCFPEKSEGELKNIARLSYLNLSDITLEAFKGYSMSEAVLQKRFKVLNAELPQQYLDTGRKVMLLGAHYGNWEWGGVSIPLSLKQMTVAVYKAMSNKRLEEYMFHQRAYRNLYLAPNSLTEPTFAKFADQAVMLALVADQNPSNADREIGRAHV